jgi:hypothetical protein
LIANSSPQKGKLCTEKFYRKKFTTGEIHHRSTPQTIHWRKIKMRAIYHSKNPSQIFYRGEICRNNIERKAIFGKGGNLP